MFAALPQTLLCGLIGLPPVNGVLPQAPMHTRALADLKRLMAENRQRKQQQKPMNVQRTNGRFDNTDAAEHAPAMEQLPPAAARAAAAAAPAPAAAAAAAAVPYQHVPGIIINPFVTANGAVSANGAAHAGTEEAPSSSSDARVVLENGKDAGAAAAAAKEYHHNHGVQVGGDNACTALACSVHSDGDLIF